MRQQGRGLRSALETDGIAPSPGDAKRLGTGSSLTLRWRKADSNPWSPLHRRRLWDRPWCLVRMRVPPGETNSFTGGTDGSNPPSSSQSQQRTVRRSVQQLRGQGAELFPRRARVPSLGRIDRDRAPALNGRRQIPPEVAATLRFSTAA